MVTQSQIQDQSLFLLFSLVYGHFFSFSFIFSSQKRVAGFFSASRLADCSGFLFFTPYVSCLNDLGLRTRNHVTTRIE